PPKKPPCEPRTCEIALSVAEGQFINRVGVDDMAHVLIAGGAFAGAAIDIFRKNPFAPSVIDRMRPQVVGPEQKPAPERALRRELQPMEDGVVVAPAVLDDSECRIGPGAGQWVDPVDEAGGQ